MRRIYSRRMLGILASTDPISIDYYNALIDSWENQDAIDAHHGSPMMEMISALREKYDLHMKLERYVSDDAVPNNDEKFIRR